MTQPAPKPEAPLPPFEDLRPLLPDAPSPRRALGLAATFRSLRHRNYRLFFFGQLVSLLGTWMQTAALTWLAYQVTGQSLWPALITASGILPTFFLGTAAGALADRWSKPRLLVLTQTALMLLAMALAGLVYAGPPIPWQLLVITSLAGLAQAFDLPARMAFVVDLVGKDDLVNAVGLNSVIFNVARVAGPALGGVLLLALGPEACFLANSLSYLAAIVALALMRFPTPRPANELEGSERAPSSAATGTRGWRLTTLRDLTSNPVLLALLFLAAVMAICGWPILSLLPAVAHPDSKAGPPTRSFEYIVMLCSLGGGALAAALTVARFGTLQRSGRFIALGVCLMPIGLFGLSLANWLPWASACCGVIGYGLVLFFATGQSVVQLKAEDRHRGRVLGLWAMMLSGSVPFGNLIFGWSADYLGVTAVLRLQGSICLVAGLALLAFLGTWRPGSTN